jgi:hypothetical protein
MLTFFDIFNRKTTVSTANPLPVKGSGGADAAGAAASMNPTLVAGTDSSNVVRNLRTNAVGGIQIGTSSTSVAAGGTPSTDTQAAAGSLNVISFGLTFNGTAWERQRSANAVNATTGVGLLGTGILGQYTAVLPTYTDGQYGTLAMTANGQLQTVLATSTGISVFIGTNTVDTVPMSRTALSTQSLGYLYDGAQFVRARGDTTGAYVQERSRAYFFTETTTALAIGATATGASRNGSGAGNTAWSSFQAIARPDVAGTLSIQGSDDGSNWSPALATVAVAAGTAVTLSTPVFYQYHRAMFVNGATALTTLILRTRYSAQ